MARDLHGVEAGDEPKREQRPVLGLQADERAFQVDETDDVGRIRAAGRIVGRRQVHDPGAPPAPEGLARLVRGDGHEPWADLSGVAQRRQPPPGDRPRRLDGVLGHLDVADDDEGDPGHRGVVLGTSRPKAAASPAAASSTVRSYAGRSGRTRSVMSGRCAFDPECPIRPLDGVHARRGRRLRRSPGIRSRSA